MGDDTQHFGAQPAPSSGEKPRRKGNNGPLQAPRSLPGEESSPSSGRHFLSCTPEGERISRSARICWCIERGRAKGKRLHKMFILHAWRWRARHFTSDPARPIHFSYGTLRGLYYHWRKNGRSPAALALRVRRRKTKVTASGVVEMAKLCLAPGVLTFRAAYRKLESPRATESAYRYATQAWLGTRLAELLAHRRREPSLARAAECSLRRLQA